MPLDVPHVSRTCADCGEIVHLAEPGEGGTGIKVEKGDTFTIPAGWLTMSLDPAKARGRFTRHGLNWFVEHMVLGAFPGDASGLESFLEELERRADQELKASPKLQGLDLDTEEGANRALQIVENDRSSVEWRAAALSVTASRALEVLRTQGGSDEFAFWVARTMLQHVLLIFQSSLEPHVWAGYEQTNLVYRVATAAAATPAEARAIEALRPAFERLGEDVLAAWVGARADIADKLGITDVDPEVVNSLAAFHLARYERRREDEQHMREANAKLWANRIAGAAAGAALIAAFVGLLVALGVLGAPNESSDVAPTPRATSSAQR